MTGGAPTLEYLFLVMIFSSFLINDFEMAKLRAEIYPQQEMNKKPEVIASNV